MSIRTVLTDLDGTLLEADGTLLPEAADAWRWLVSEGVPVLALSSKTAAEVALLLADLGVEAPAGCENGGILAVPGRPLERLASAIPPDALRLAADALRATTGAPLTSFEELSDAELGALTGLTGPRLAAARERQATLPLLVESAWDGRLAAALPEAPALRLLRGNRFLHLQGLHDKADAAPRLLELVKPGAGLLVACGDAPNDLDLLRMADVRVIVPGLAGPDPTLATAFPDALVAPRPGGRGWAAAVVALQAGQTAC